MQYRRRATARRRRPPAWPAIALLALTLAGCGTTGSETTSAIDTSASTTQTTQTTETTAAPTTTRQPTTTTKRPTTTTRRPATTSPPADCHSSYVGECLHVGIGDYDCAGGSGNGPNYVYGTVRVRGSDPFDLVRDGDGIGCE